MPLAQGRWAEAPTRCADSFATRGCRARVCRQAQAGGSFRRISAKSEQFDFSNINGHETLMGEIRSIKQPSDLLPIIRKGALSGRFDSIHAGTCLYEAARRIRSSNIDFQRTLSSQEFQNMIDFTEYLCGEMKPYTVANVAWSLAEFSREGFLFRRLSSALADRATELSDRFSSRYLSNIVYGFGRMRFKHARMLEALSSASILKIDEFNAQDLSNLVWGMAMLEEPRVSLMEAVSERRQACIEGSVAHGFSNIAWAYARLGINDEGLMRSLAAELTTRAGELSMTGKSLTTLAHVLYASSTFGIFHKPLLTVCARRLTSKKLRTANQWSIRAMLAVTSMAPCQDGVAELHSLLEREAASRGKIDEGKEFDLLDTRSWTPLDAYRPLQVLL